MNRQHLPRDRLPPSAFALVRFGGRVARPALRSLFCVVDFDLGLRTFILELQACLQRRRKGPVFRVELSTNFDDIALARVSIVRNKVLHKSPICRGEAEMPTQISYAAGIAVRLNDRVNFS